MTVPLMRRHGARMPTVAVANPLNFPVAIVGSPTYVLARRIRTRPGTGYLGFVRVAAFVFSRSARLPEWAGGQDAAKIPDKVHAYVYVGLLVLVLVMMLL